MLKHIEFIGFDTEKPAEDFIDDITRGKWTLLHMGSNCNYRIDLDRAASVEWDSIDPEKRREPLKLCYWPAAMMKPPHHKYNNSQIRLDLKNVRRIEKNTNYYLRYNNGDCICLSTNQNPYNL